MEYIEDKNFDGDDFTLTGLVKANYENCRFIDCNFSEVDRRLDGSKPSDV